MPYTKRSRRATLRSPTPLVRCEDRAKFGPRLALDKSAGLFTFPSRYEVLQIRRSYVGRQAGASVHCLSNRYDLQSGTFPPEMLRRDRKLSGRQKILQLLAGVTSELKHLPVNDVEEDPSPAFSLGEHFSRGSYSGRSSSNGKARNKMKAIIA
ncbi:hypothetical protein J6590_000512 [Homalodisca vitripennis]|nr:hypothetical protein J6590_000512 [Homalodisca vitripennis]